MAQDYETVLAEINSAEIKTLEGAQQLLGSITQRVSDKTIVVTEIQLATLCNTVVNRLSEYRMNRLRTSQGATGKTEHPGTTRGFGRTGGTYR